MERFWLLVIGAEQACTTLGFRVQGVRGLRAYDFSCHAHNDELS